jgi:anti-sigma factor RsiW
VSSHVTDEQLSLLADGELSLVSRRAVLAHLEACPACAARHDGLIDVVAALRLQPGVAWTPEHTGAVVNRGRATARSRDRGLPLAIGLTLLALVLGALSWRLMEAGARVGFRFVSTVAALVSHQVGVSVAVLGGLAALALIAAAVTLPLARWR